MLLLCVFTVDYNFFTANPQMFAVRNRFTNLQIKTLSPQFTDRFVEVPSTGLERLTYKLEIRIVFYQTLNVFKIFNIEPFSIFQIFNIDVFQYQALRNFVFYDVQFGCFLPHFGTNYSSSKIGLQ